MKNYLRWGLFGLLGLGLFAFGSVGCWGSQTYTPQRPSCEVEWHCLDPTICFTMPDGPNFCDTDLDGNGQPDLFDHGWTICEGGAGNHTFTACFNIVEIAYAGSPCQYTTDCRPSDGLYCNTNVDICTSGALGEVCIENLDYAHSTDSYGVGGCQDGLVCFDSFCQKGTEGDACGVAGYNSTKPIGCAQGFTCKSFQCTAGGCEVAADCPAGKTCTKDNQGIGLCTTGQVGAACFESDDCLPSLSCRMVPNPLNKGSYSHYWATYLGAGFESACTDDLKGSPCTVDSCVYHATSQHPCTYQSKTKQAHTCDTDSNPKLRCEGYVYATDASKIVGRLGTCTEGGKGTSCHATHNEDGWFRCRTGSYQSSCCSKSNNPGCNDYDCEQLVRAANPGACQGVWSEQCAAYAAQHCTVCEENLHICRINKESCVSSESGWESDEVFCPGTCGPAQTGDPCFKVDYNTTVGCGWWMYCVSGKCTLGQAGDPCIDNECTSGLKCFGGVCVQ